MFNMSRGNLSQNNRAALMIALHKLIEDSSEKVVGELFFGDVTANIFYPPNGGLSDVEREAGRAIATGMKNIPGAEMFLRKLLANNSAEILFTLFNWIDGTEDLGGSWTGVDLIDTSDEDKEMLHDVLLESYWEWKKVRSKKNWSLDTLEE